MWKQVIPDLNTKSTKSHKAFSVGCYALSFKDHLLPALFSPSLCYGLPFTHSAPLRAGSLLRNAEEEFYWDFLYDMPRNAEEEFLLTFLEGICCARV